MIQQKTVRLPSTVQFQRIPIGIKGGVGRPSGNQSQRKPLSPGGFYGSRRTAGAFPKSTNLNSSGLTIQQQRANRALKASDRIVDRFLGTRSSLRLSDFTGGKNPMSNLAPRRFGGQVGIPVREIVDLFPR